MPETSPRAPLVRRSSGASNPANSPRAAATLMRVQLSAASPGGSTASANVLSVRRAMSRLKRGVRMTNSWNWFAEDAEPVKVLRARHRLVMLGASQC